MAKVTDWRYAVSTVSFIAWCFKLYLTPNFCPQDHEWYKVQNYMSLLPTVIKQNPKRIFPLAVRLWRLWRLWRPHVSAVEATCISCLCCTCQFNLANENKNKISFIKYLPHCRQLNTNFSVTIYEQKICHLPWNTMMFSKKSVGFVIGKTKS